MQTVAEVMTRDAHVVSPQESVQRAAQLMDELNVGALPVCDGHKLVGIVALGDLLAKSGKPQTATEVAGRISSPSASDAPGRQH